MNALVSVLMTLVIIFGLTIVIIFGLTIWGMVGGYIKIGKPETLNQTAYLDSQRELMNALVEEVDGE